MDELYWLVIVLKNKKNRVEWSGGISLILWSDKMNQNEIKFFFCTISSKEWKEKHKIQYRTIVQLCPAPLVPLYLYTSIRMEIV